MSKRLITATVGLAFGALALGTLATSANARPHDWSPRSFDQSYSDADDDDDRPVRRHRRQAKKSKPTKKEASKPEQQPQQKQPQQQLVLAKPEQQSQQQPQHSDEQRPQQAAKPSESSHVPLRRSPPSRREVAGASRNCLTPAARALLGRIEGQFGAMQLISTCRPGARIAGSGRISRHASGNAIDFSAGSRKGAVVRWLIANHKSGGTMTYSNMSHIHVDIGPHFVSLGARGG
jgi:uncharacterized protein YcbK (DUF882 family)